MHLIAAFLLVTILFGVSRAEAQSEPCSALDHFLGTLSPNRDCFEREAVEPSAERPRPSAPRRPPRTANSQPESPLNSDFARLMRYWPVTVTGPRNASTRVVFWWSAFDNRSVAAFHQVIRPLMIQRRPDVVIVMIQLMRDDVRDQLGPGVFLLCAQDSRAYGRAVIRYLGRASERGHDVEAVFEVPQNERILAAKYSNELIREQFADGSLNVARCRNDVGMAARVFNMLSMAEMYGNRPSNIGLPQIAINERPYRSDDPRVKKALGLR